MAIYCPLFLRTVPRLESCKVSQACHDLRVIKGTRNPIYPIRSFHASISCCLKRRTKGMLTVTDLEDAECFVKNQVSQFKPEALEMKEEALTQIEYF